MLERPLDLPCGATLANRLAKAALTERLADPQNRSTERLERLYACWSHSGAGLLITGNVLIDRDHLEASGNVVLDGRADLEALRRYAAAGTDAGNHLWMQLSHAGRQTPAAINPAPKAPSAVQLNVKHGSYGTPTPMTEADIDTVVAGFAHAAETAQACGFTGIQLHAAHGYLLSAFMNPQANQRNDAYGGSLENRARLLLQSVEASRAATGAEFPISVKLNSADFQNGGFDLNDCVQVATWLEEAGVDLLELSGGNYESPAMIMGRRGDIPAVRESTRLREAFFIDYAAYLRKHTAVPMMVTGGFRSHAAMAEALQVGATDVVGLGRTFCVEPDLPKVLLESQATAKDVESGLNPPYAAMPWYYCQLARLGDGSHPDLGLTGLDALAEHTAREERILADLKAARAEATEPL